LNVPAFVANGSKLNIVWDLSVTEALYRRGTPAASIVPKADVFAGSSRA
jgi:hypothetical protein